jgi:hypothetical protein
MSLSPEEAVRVRRQIKARLWAIESDVVKKSGLRKTWLDLLILALMWGFFGAAVWCFILAAIAVFW